MASPGGRRPAGTSGAGESRDPEPPGVPYVTGDPAADTLLAGDPLARVVGMLLDQQVPIEWAFAAPLRLRQRLGDRWSAAGIAATPPDALAALFSAKPALHRYPRAMAERTRALCQALVDRYGGDAAALWAGVADGEDLRGRLVELPGFGDEKARIFIAFLAKRYGVRPAGWEHACAPFADGQPRTVADITSPAALAEVRAWKRAQRAAGRSKSDPG